VTVALTVPANAFAIFDPGTVLSTVLQDEWKLASQGANIGRVIVQVSDITSGQPLYTEVGDVTIAFEGRWYSPLVAGLAAEILSPGQATTQATQALSGVQNATGVQAPPVP
jgi:hypothetical protein